MNAKKTLVTPVLAAVLLLSNFGVIFNSNFAAAQAGATLTIRTTADDHRA